MRYARYVLIRPIKCPAHAPMPNEPSKERGVPLSWKSLRERIPFLQKTETLFKEYIDTFAKIKLEASGYPKDCLTNEQSKPQAYMGSIGSY